MANAPKPATMAELARLRDAGRAVEIVDGEIVEKAMPSPEHGSAQAALAFLLGPFRGGGGPERPGGWWLMTEVEVLYELDRQVYRHDAVGFRRDRHPSRPAGLPVTARPDWACEVLSTSTARVDTVKKQRVLHRHQVPHYWLVDPERETLTVLRWGADGYTNVLNAEVGEVVRAEPFESIEIAIEELFEPSSLHR